VSECKNNHDNDKLKYHCRGIGNDSSCALQLSIDASALINLESDLIKHFHEFSYNTIRFNLQQFKTVSEIMQVIQFVKKWNQNVQNQPFPLTIVFSACAMAYVPHHTMIDDVVVDMAIGFQAHQLTVDGMFLQETSSKFLRLLTLQEEAATMAATSTLSVNASPALSFVGSKFRYVPT
jgi:hypothetical protein